MFLSAISRNGVFEIFASLRRSQTRVEFKTKIILNYQVLYTIRKVYQLLHAVNTIKKYYMFLKLQLFECCENGSIRQIPHVLQYRQILTYFEKFFASLS
jgi:hypothetical protein